MTSSTRRRRWVLQGAAVPAAQRRGSAESLSSTQRILLNKHTVPSNLRVVACLDLFVIRCFAFLLKAWLVSRSQLKIGWCTSRSTRSRGTQSNAQPLWRRLPSLAPAALPPVGALAPPPAAAPTPRCAALPWSAPAGAASHAYAAAPGADLHSRTAAKLAGRSGAAAAASTGCQPAAIGQRRVTTWLPHVAPTRTPTSSAPW